jgi:hypothetical protein
MKMKVFVLVSLLSLLGLAFAADSLEIDWSSGGLSSTPAPSQPSALPAPLPGAPSAETTPFSNAPAITSNGNFLKLYPEKKLYSLGEDTELRFFFQNSNPEILNGLEAWDTLKCRQPVWQMRRNRSTEPMPALGGYIQIDPFDFEDLPGYAMAMFGGDHDFHLVDGSYYLLLKEEIGIPEVGIGNYAYDETNEYRVCIECGTTNLCTHAFRISNASITVPFPGFEVTEGCRYCETLLHCLACLDKEVFVADLFGASSSSNKVTLTVEAREEGSSSSDKKVVPGIELQVHDAENGSLIFKGTTNSLGTISGQIEKNKPYYVYTPGNSSFEGQTYATDSDGAPGNLYIYVWLRKHS